MTEVVVATLSVSFDATDSGDGSGELKLEIDDREEGPNGGETSFGPGDEVYFFLFKGSSVTLVNVDGKAVASTAGAASSYTMGVTIEKEENITFSNSDTASLGYPLDSIIGSPVWLGKCFEIKGTTATANTAVPEYTTGSSELKMTGGKKVAGICKIKYNAKGDLYKLSGVPVDFKEVLLISMGTY